MSYCDDFRISEIQHQVVLISQIKEELLVLNQQIQDFLYKSNSDII